jgi:hypothetical protein
VRVLLVLAALICAAPAYGYTTSDELSHVSSVFANGRAWPVECIAPQESDGSLDQWVFGFTDMAEHYVALRADLCPLAEHPEDETTSPWDRAIAVLALVHESYHVRNWSWRWNEARVECQAIRHFKIGVKLLGGSQQNADDLLPYALAWHFLIARPGTPYFLSGCRVPSW